MIPLSSGDIYLSLYHSLQYHFPLFYQSRRFCKVTKCLVDRRQWKTCVHVLILLHKAWYGAMAIVLWVSWRLIVIVAVGIFSLAPSLLLSLFSLESFHRCCRRHHCRCCRRCRRCCLVVVIFFSLLLLLSAPLCRRRCCCSFGASSWLLSLMLDSTIWVVKLARAKRLGL